MSRYAIVLSGRVQNVVEAGSPPPNGVLLADGVAAGPGWLYDGSSYTPTPRTPSAGGGSGGGGVDLSPVYSSINLRAAKDLSDATPLLPGGRLKVRGHENPTYDQVGGALAIALDLSLDAPGTINTGKELHVVHGEAEMTVSAPGGGGGGGQFRYLDLRLTVAAGSHVDSKSYVGIFSGTNLGAGSLKPLYSRVVQGPNGGPIAAGVFVTVTGMGGGTSFLQQWEANAGSGRQTDYLVYLNPAPSGVWEAGWGFYSPNSIAYTNAWLRIGNYGGGNVWQQHDTVGLHGVADAVISKLTREGDLYGRKLFITPGPAATPTANGQMGWRVGDAGGGNALVQTMVRHPVSGALCFANIIATPE